MNAPHSLVVSIVPHGSGEEVAAAANAAGAGGGTALLGRGTAASSILQLLGLGDRKDTVTLVPGAESSETASFLNNAKEAVDFARHLQLEEGPLAAYDAADYQVYAISKQNYTTLYNRKRVAAYKQFYDKYYTP